ncbi:hypothetical protein G5V59_25830 [Nocardioides sp. W3-2-3]|uniref:M1 family aminopeptidase n=1 Tax=Nocardioides convexus TaxID=2712224 RepID=UPI002418999C|nr:M1 family aminopeptidase [Nocardioides convexus]NHA01903.1 hypothetical protein [Nocardioides convexus]
MLLLLLVPGFSGAAVRTAAPGGSTGPDPYWKFDGNGGTDALRYDVRVSYDFSRARLSGRTIVTLRAKKDLSSLNLDLLLPVSAVTVDGRRARFGKPNNHEPAHRPGPLDPQGRDRQGLRRLRRLPGALPLRRGAQLAGRRRGGRGDERAPHGAVVVPLQRPPQRQGRLRHPRHHPSGQAGDQQRQLRRAHRPGHQGHHALADERPDGDLPRVLRGGPVPGRDRPQRLGDPLRQRGLGAPAEGRPGPGDGRAAPQRRDHGLAAVVAREVPLHLHRRAGHQPRRGLRAGEPDASDVREPGSTRASWCTSLAHQWFGDSVSVQRWRDIWLNEGFATFAEVAYDAAHGGPSVRAWLDRAYDERCRQGGSSFWTLDISNPGPAKVFDEGVYDRGSMVLAALQNRIGATAMRDLLRAWVAAHHDGNATVAQFEAMASARTGQDLRGFFQAWLRSGTVPAGTPANGLTHPCP